MIWEDAAQLAERIAKSPDAGTLHVAVIVAPEGQGYAVAIREHGRHELHYVQSMNEFQALCEWLLAPRSS
ncbi:MAG: hypothetical protein ETSY1_08065 [Candidatus Entotheonella factor]|uniref:Uncharacterized protein n=1 Tax=Entotheonella factor TaxID=1429438 RepID=W4LT71_ENTF1|nr:hypothetical protein [Candidatus Entotheonella palauensis]ETX01249.1 MAG: hypothetical protein ETSY1_08065 [Candidatus Entotheonella factor]